MNNFFSMAPNFCVLLHRILHRAWGSLKGSNLWVLWTVRRRLLLHCGAHHVETSIPLPLLPFLTPMSGGYFQRSLATESAEFFSWETK